MKRLIKHMKKMSKRMLATLLMMLMVFSMDGVMVMAESISENGMVAEETTEDITEDGNTVLGDITVSEATLQEESSNVQLEVQRNGVSLGGVHSAAITTDGDLYTWGYNDYGQLGDGTTKIKSTPVKIMNDVASVSLGGVHSAAITTDGDLYTWGYNDYGQLGDGTTKIKSTPIKIMNDVASVSLGGAHSAAITTDGDLYTWGCNNSGILGDGTTESKSTPVKIMSDVASVSLGEAHSAAITTDGDLYTWGYNGDGQLGDGTTENKSTPVKIMSDVASVSLGRFHSAAITTDGDLYTWGYNVYGQLGDGTTESKSTTPVKIMSDVASVSLGDFHSAAITTDGDLYTWGYNSDGQLGDGTTESKSTTPVKIMSDVASVSLGDFHSAAITTDGDLYTWGYNSDGQLGDGTTVNKYTPIKIMDNIYVPGANQNVSDVIELGVDISDVSVPNNAIGICAVDTDSNRVIENATIYIDGTAYDSGKEGVLYFTDNMLGTKHIYYAMHSGYNVVPYAEVVFEKGNLYKVYLTKKTSDTQAFTTPQCVYGKLTGLNSISGTIEIDGKEYSVSDSFNEFNNCWSSGDAVYAAFDKNKKIVTLEPIDNHIRPIVSVKSQDTPINYDGNKYSKDSIDLEVTLGCELYPKADIPESLKEQSVYVDKLKLSFDGISMSFEKEGLISDNIVNEKELKINETLKLKEQKSYSEKLYLRTENVDLEGKTDEAYSIHCDITYGDEQTINRLGLMQVQIINLPLQAEKAALKQNSISANPDYTNLAGKIQNFESQMVLPGEISELIGNKNTEKMVRELLSYAIVRDMACFKLKADKSVSDEFIEKVFQITDQSDMIRNLFKQGHITEQINVDTQEYGNQTIMFDVKYDVGGFNTSSPQYGIGWISYKVVGDKNSIKKVPKAYQQSSSKGMITYAYTQDLFDAASKCLMSSIKKYYNSAIGDIDVIAGYALDDTTKKTFSALNWGWGTAESIANGGNSSKKKFANYKDAVWYIITEPTKKSVTNGRVKCPVDLYFYNSENELCGAIVNDEVIFSNDEIVLWVDDNEKKFQFLGDEFHIKYVGNDSGTMNCTINRFEGDITIPTRVIELYDVPLTENTIYYGYIPENPYTNNNMYILQEEGGEKIAVDYDSLNITVPVKVDVENIALDNSCLEMHVGDSKQLSYIISPYNATRKDVMWVSNDENVVTVDADGVIYAKAQGKTQIIAYILGENEVASCDVTVLTSQNDDSDGKQPEAGAPLTPTNDSETRIRAFVSRMYTVALGREAEQRGLDDWSRQLLEHTNDGAGLARGFICSAEFTNKNLSNDAYVNTLYRTFFDREPDFDGKVYWIAALNRGTKRNEVLAGFVNSLEFANLCDSYGIARGTMESNGSSIYNADVRNYVLRMYTKCLKRDGETIGVEDWSHRINTKAMDPETVAKSFFTSEEFLNKNLSNEDYVETLYETFMDRPSDETGKADWVNKLNSGVSRQTVLEGFSRSPEFAKIMASFGL